MERRACRVGHAIIGSLGGMSGNRDAGARKGRALAAAAGGMAGVGTQFPSSGHTALAALRMHEPPAGAAVGQRFVHPSPVRARIESVATPAPLP